MKRLALCLIAAIPGLANAQDVRQPISIVPFEVMESHPLCAGPGKMPVRVSFDVKGALVRFGAAGAAPARVCEIKTRRGADVKSIPIPCPDEEPAQTATEATLKDWPRQADLAGDVVACLGMSDVSIVAGNWTMSGMTPAGAVLRQGDLTDPALTVVFRGATAGLSQGAPMKDRTEPAVVVVAWDKVDVSQDAGAPVAVSSFLVLSASALSDELCNTDACWAMEPSAGFLALTLGGSRIGDLVDYVEGN